MRFGSLVELRNKREIISKEYRECFDKVETKKLDI
jgi:hypothetical protein